MGEYQNSGCNGLFICNFQGKEIIEFFIDELKQEGITEVPIWVDSNPTSDAAEVVGATDQPSSRYILEFVFSSKK